MKKRYARLRLAWNRDRETGGYTSGFNLSRGTPETDSTRSTRRAGTFPDFFHFWTAWWDTPHERANLNNPPLALIASSTELMRDNLQPIVALSQQGIVANRRGTLQPMVVRTKSDAKKGFGKALNEFLDGVSECPNGRGRTTWLRARLNKHARSEVVTYEAVRKWLKGLEIPDQSNLVILMDAIKATWPDLFPEISKTSSLASLIQILDHDQQQQVLGFIHGILASRSREAS